MKKPADLGGEGEPKNPDDAPTGRNEDASIEARIEMEAFREALIDGVQKMRGAGLVNLPDD
jgi:hypothetical protein